VTAVDSSNNESAYSSEVIGIIPVPPPPVPSAGLVLYYDFEEDSGTTVLDQSGNGHDGHIENGARRTSQGYFDKAMEFDGIAGNVDLGALDMTGHELTITLWLKADDFGTLDARLVSKSTSQAEQDQYWMLSTVHGPRLRFRVKTTEGGTTTLSANSATVAAGQWVHMAAVYDGTRMVIYQDGVEVGSQAKRGALVSAPTVPVWIGANPGFPNQVFDGLIDEVRIYNRALSPTELHAIAQY
jgi:hypothetical protein